MEILGHPVFLAMGGYLTSATCLILAFLVLKANPRSKSCRLAFFFNASVGFWAFFYGTEFLVNEAWAVFSCRMLSIGTALLSPFITHLTLVEVGLEARRKKLLFWNYAAAGFLSILILAPEIVIAGAPPKLSLPHYVEGGPLYFLVPLQVFINFFYSAWLLVRGIKKARGYRKHQLFYFLAALAAGYGFGTPAYLLAFNIPVMPLTSPLVTLYPLILSYAIVKHRFLNIEKLLKNTVLFCLLFLLLLGAVSVILYLLTHVIGTWVGVPDPAAQAFAIGLALLLYEPLKKALSRLTHRLLYQHRENPANIFNRLSEDILCFLDPGKLALEVTSRLAGILALERIAFYSLGKGVAPIFGLRAHVGQFRKKEIHETRPLAQYLERIKTYLITTMSPLESRLLSRQKRSPFLADLKEVKKEAMMELARLGGIAAFPVFVKKSLHAILIVGRKKSDAPWREEEFQIIGGFAHHLSIALGNAEYAQALLRSRRELVRSERDATAGALIAGMDHEVKSPLHALYLSLTNLKASLNERGKTGLADERARGLIVQTMEGVLEDAASVNQVIQHLSDLAERKSLVIREDVRPRALAEKAAGEVLGEKDGKEIDWELEISPDLTLACDPEALQEILTNLLRNAEQAIPRKGKIRLEGTRENGEVLIRVRDTGTGIPPDSMKKLFEPFFTTKRKGQRVGKEGSGMGLFIVKEYMLGMGGKVEVRSEPGEGAEFTLRFPNLEHRGKENP